MRITFILFIGLIANSELIGQSVQEKLMLTDTKDSVLLKSESPNFDSTGRYLFETVNDSGEYFIDNNGKTGPLKQNWGSSISKYTLLKDEDVFYYHSAALRIFGPFKGDDLAHFRNPISKNKQHVATPCFFKDRIAIYIDGKLITKVDTLTKKEWYSNLKQENPFESKEIYFQSDDWCQLSNNGNCLFSVENGLRYNLFFNGSIINTSENEIYPVRVNDNGNYIYSVGRKPMKNENYTYDYMFFIHTKDSVFAPVRTVWDSYLNEDGSYYCKGDDSGPEYILIDNAMYKGIKEINCIRLPDKTHYMFSYAKDDGHYMNVNGKSEEYNFQDIFYPTLDTNGNYAFYGLRNYYLYKFINGKEISEPITKYGVRPVPLYISPTGESLHIFKTEDSTYLYRDDKMLYKLSNDKNLSIIEPMDFLTGEYEKDKPLEGNNFFYMEIDSVGYVVFNGQFSRPMLPAKTHGSDDEKPIGQIISAERVGHGFYFIQKTGARKYLININNSVYREVDDLDRIYSGNTFFDGGKLIFYGVKGLSFYQFSVKE